MAIKLLYMPFYGFDYETDSRCKLLSDAEHGVYFRLLWEQWKEGDVPDDPADAAAIIRSDDVAAVASVLDKFFKPSEPGRRRNGRLLTIRRTLEAERLAKSKGGIVGRTTQLVIPEVGAEPPEPRPTVQRPPPDPQVVAVLEVYQSLHPGRKPFVVPGIPKIAAHRAVKAALNWGFTVEELQAALRANASDTWHVERGKHELEYVLRTEDKVCGWIARAGTTDRDGGRDVYAGVSFDAPDGGS